MLPQQEKEPKKDSLARLEVPRVSVDLMGDDLTGRQKLTVINYLMLEDSIFALGTQKFEKATLDNIPLKPVRDWVKQHWQEEFVLDLSKRNLPISFRVSLALALFTTRITRHLSEVEGGVEVYATRKVQGVLREHKLPELQGLITIDYASLPTQVKADLVIPIIDNLSQAQLVAQAKVLFPDGIPTRALYLADLSSMMALLFS